MNTDPNRFASPLPDVVPNTHPDEPSFPITQAPPRAETPPPVPSPARPPLRKRRRVTQQEASDNESNDVPMPESQKPSSQRAGSEAPAVPSQAVTRRKITRRQPSQPVEPPPEPEPEPEEKRLTNHLRHQEGYAHRPLYVCVLCLLTSV